MIAIGLLFVRMLCDFFKPRPRLEAEILILRHQLNVLQQRTPRRRLHLRWVDPSLTLPGCFSGVFPVKRAGQCQRGTAIWLIRASWIGLSSKLVLSTSTQAVLFRAPSTSGLVLVIRQPHGHLATDGVVL